MIFKVQKFDFDEADGLEKLLKYQILTQRSYFF